MFRTAKQVYKKDESNTNYFRKICNCIKIPDCDVEWINSIVSFAFVSVVVYVLGSIAELIVLAVYIFGSGCPKENSLKIFYTFYVPTICIIGVPLFLIVVSVILFVISIILYYCFMVMKSIFIELKRYVGIVCFVIMNYNNDRDIIV